MQEKLIELVCERTGIPAETAEKAVTTVLGFLKENPDQLQGLLGDDADGSFLEKLRNLLPGGDDDGEKKEGEGLTGKLGKMFGRD